MLCLRDVRVGRMPGLRTNYMCVHVVLIDDGMHPEYQIKKRISE